MNIILTPAVSSCYLSHCNPNPSLDELTYLTGIVDGIHAALTDSIKDTPFITITKFAAPIDKSIPKIDTLSRNTPPSSKLLIAVGLNASIDDDHYHTSRGWSVCNNSVSKQSDIIALSLATAALQTLGSMAASPQDQFPSQRYLNFTAILAELKIPAALTLNLYQDNVRDAAYILSSTGRQAIIDLHIKGILEYLALSS